MYISAKAVLTAIQELQGSVHPFLGITFLACKQYGLSVGSQDDVRMDAITRDHLDAHHRIDRRSAFYFQPFKSARPWVSEKYPSGGLQTINTQTFKSVFLHERNIPKWGFQTDYLERMTHVLREQNAAIEVPADALAIWLFKDAELGGVSDYDGLIELFFTTYNITAAERTLIFAKQTMADFLRPEDAFVSEPLEMTAVTRPLAPPPDAEAEGGSTITALRLKNVGPAADMMIEFGQRLTILTGDNGLGKSFLLDFAWSAATGEWGKRSLPPPDSKTTPSVSYTLRGVSDRLSEFSPKFDRRSFVWSLARGAMTVEALAVFSRADGSFAVADPFRDKIDQHAPSAHNLAAGEVWNGRLPVISGLIADWVRWQTAADRKTFDQFALVLKRLSPDDLGELTPGEPVRLPGDVRDIPTIRHRYGTIPVTFASAGVQRVLLLAYLIIWSWREHTLAAERLGRQPLRRMMAVVDELEAHLHPKWQRIVLPALMSIGDVLSGDIALQTIAATHSPMILASMEASFDSSTDRLYHLYGDGPVVKLEETPFVKYGDVSGWLTSPLFGLRHARSREADLAIEDAKKLQLEDDPTPKRVAEVTERLKRALADDDRFWPRWLFFAEKYGVSL
jgi:hypothetical protein